MFSRIGRVLAALMVVLAVLRIGLAAAIIFGSPDVETVRATSRAYLGATLPGEAIDQGARWLLIAVFLGILCEISRSLGTLARQTTTAREDNSRAV